MGRKGRICHQLLTAVCLLSLYGCSFTERDGDRYGDANLTVRLSCNGMNSRTHMPDEDKVTDSRILIFDESGGLEAELKGKEGEIRLMSGRNYTILAYANLKQPVKGDDLEEIMMARHVMESPYDYENGIPMSIAVRDFHLEMDTTLNLKLERLMSKISIRIDRSRLDGGTEVEVKKVRIGNCPSDALIFQKSSVRDSSECFDIGFEHHDTVPLNNSGPDGMSGEICLYLLENMQGVFSENGPSSEKDKIFSENDVRRQLCSYIEMEMEYHSDSLYCTDNPLVYRFYIGDGLNSLNVERNCHYRITVCPDGDGLSEDIWRIEKSGLHSYVQEITLTESYILLDYPGKSAMLEPDVFPAAAYQQTLSWESSDPGVASVDSEGNIKAKSEGECIVTCSSTDGSNVTASCLVRCEFAPPRFTAYPEDRYINGDIGDTVRLWCEVFPPNTPFDVGLEYLEDDKAAGIYDYVIDDDGHGVTLILTGAGSGMIYMEAFEPVNDAALYFIEVNMPDDG